MWYQKTFSRNKISPFYATSCYRKPQHYKYVLIMSWCLLVTANIYIRHSHILKNRCFCSTIWWYRGGSNALEWQEITAKFMEPAYLTGHSRKERPLKFSMYLSMSKITCLILSFKVERKLIIDQSFHVILVSLSVKEDCGTLLQHISC